MKPPQLVETARRTLSGAQGADAEALSPPEASRRLEEAFVAVKQEGADILRTRAQRLAFHGVVDGISAAIGGVLRGAKAPVEVHRIGSPSPDSAATSVKMMALIRGLQVVLGLSVFLVALADRSAYGVLAATLVILLLGLQIAWSMLDPARLSRPSLRHLVFGPAIERLKGCLDPLGLRRAFGELLPRTAGTSALTRDFEATARVVLPGAALAEAAERALDPLQVFLRSIEPPEVAAPELPASLDHLIQVVAGRLRDDDMPRLRHSLEIDLPTVLEDLKISIEYEWSPEHESRLWEARVGAEVDAPRVVRPAMRRGAHVARGLVFLPINGGRDR